MIKQDMVRKVAEVARINLTDSEVKMFAKDMESILGSFKVIEKVDTKNVRPSFQPVDVKNVTREDIVTQSLPQKVALSNTKNTEDGNFVGPKVV